MPLLFDGLGTFRACIKCSTHVYIRTKIAVCNGMLVDIVTCVTPQGCVLTCLNQWPLTPSSYCDSAGDKHFPTAEFIGLKLVGQLVICCMSTDRVWPHYSLCSLLIVCSSVRLCTTGMLAHEVFKSFLLNWTVSMLLVMRHPRTSLWKTAKPWQQRKLLSENTLISAIDIPVNAGFF